MDCMLELRRFEVLSRHDGLWTPNGPRPWSLFRNFVSVQRRWDPSCRLPCWIAPTAQDIVMYSPVYQQVDHEKRTKTQHDLLNTRMSCEFGERQYQEGIISENNRGWWDGNDKYIQQNTNFGGREHKGAILQTLCMQNLCERIQHTQPARYISLIRLIINSQLCLRIHQGSLTTKRGNETNWVGLKSLLGHRYSYPTCWPTTSSRKI